MDYKELIETLRKKDGCNCECLRAADAIEILLAERDAAVNDLALCASCATCQYKGGAIKQPCFMCGTIMPSKGKTRWEWRGTKKED